MAELCLRSVAVAAVIAAIIYALWPRGSFPFAGHVWQGMLAAQPFSALALLLTGATGRILAGPPARYRDVLGAVAVVIVSFMFLPHRLSDAMKPAYLARTSGLPLSRGFAALSIERLLDVLMVGILIALALGLATTKSESLRLIGMTFWALGAVGVAGILTLLVAPSWIAWIIDLVPFNRPRHLLHKLLAALKETVAPWRVGLAVLTAAATWLTSFAIFWSFLYFAGSIPLSPSAVLTVFALGTVGLAVPVTPGGIGTFEAAVVLGLSYFGYDLHEALKLAVMLRIANLIVPAIVVLGIILRDDVDLSGLIRSLRDRAKSRGVGP